MTCPNGNSEFCFPETLNVPRGEAGENIEVEGKQNSLFPEGPDIKCFFIPPDSNATMTSHISKFPPSWICHKNFKVSAVHESEELHNSFQRIRKNKRIQEASLCILSEVQTKCKRIDEFVNLQNQKQNLSCQCLLH